MKSLLSQSTLAALCVIASHASADLVTTSSVQRYVSPNNIGNYSELPGATFTPTSSQSSGSLDFAMTGDLRLELDPGAFNTPFRQVIIGGTQQFEVGGHLPMQITPDAFTNYKIVHAGGPADVPYGVAYALATLSIYETGGYTNGDPTFARIGALVSEISIGLVPQLFGNGFAIADQYTYTDPYVLLPGTNYTAVWGFTLNDTTDDLIEGGPAAATFLEMGGITNFDGLNFHLNAVTVPSPSTCAITALAGMMTIRRRRSTR